MAWQSLQDIYSTKVLSPVKQESTEIKLSDIYSEQVVRDNNVTSLEPQQKEWRSLSDVYTEGTKSNNINEGFVAIYLDKGVTRTFNLADVYVREILQKAEFLKDNIGEIVKAWVESGGWRGKDAGVITNFIIGEINQLNKDGIIDEQGKTTAANFNLIKEDIVQLINTKKVNKNFKKALDSKKFNYLDMIRRDELRVLKGKILQNIYDFAFSKFKNVSVGSGEVAATLFTEAKAAPDAGDLIVGDSLIEIKKQGGIVGQAGPGKELLKIMSKTKVITDEILRLRRAREEEIKAFNNLIGDKVNKELIKKVVDQLESEQKIEEFKPDSDKAKLLGMLQLLQRKTKFTSQDFKCTFEDIRLPIPGSIQRAVGSRKPEFEPLHKIKNSIIAIKSFCDFKVTKTNSEYFKAAAKNDQLGKDAVNTYLNSTSIVIGPDITDTIENSGLKPLKKIGALAIVDYQIKEKFVYLVLTEKDYNSIVIGPFNKENTAGNIQMVFDSISDINFKMSGGRETGKFEMFIGSSPAGDDSQYNNTGLDTPATQPTVLPPVVDDADTAIKNIL